MSAKTPFQQEVGQILGFLTSPWEDFKFLLNLIKAFVSWFSVIPSLFLRHNFGDRAIRFLDVMAANLLSGGVMLVLMIIGGAAKSPPFLLLTINFAVWPMFLYHRRAIRLRTQRWHSRYHGDSHLSRFLPYPETTVKKWFEPAFCLFLGAFLAITMIDFAAGCWLMLSGVSLRLDLEILLQEFRDKVLDAIDAEIEGQQLQRALQQSLRASEMDGAPFPDPNSIFPLSHQSQERRQEVVEQMRRGHSTPQSVEEVIGRLAPELQKLLKKESEGREQ